MASAWEAVWANLGADATVMLGSHAAWQRGPSAGINEWPNKRLPGQPVPKLRHLTPHVAVVRTAYTGSEAAAKPARQAPSRLQDYLRPSQRRRR